jgi:hypothetical protein
LSEMLALFRNASGWTVWKKSGGPKYNKHTMEVHEPDEEHRERITEKLSGLGDDLFAKWINADTAPFTFVGKGGLPAKAELSALPKHVSLFQFHHLDPRFNYTLVGASNTNMRLRFDKMMSAFAAVLLSWVRDGMQNNNLSFRLPPDERQAHDEFFERKINYNEHVRFWEENPVIAVKKLYYTCIPLIRDGLLHPGQRLFFVFPNTQLYTNDANMMPLHESLMEFLHELTNPALGGHKTMSFHEPNSLEVLDENNYVLERDQEPPEASLKATTRNISAEWIAEWSDQDIRSP